MVTKTGWYNKNMTGNPPKYESHRHSLASRGIKTSAPKGVKGVSSAFSPTPNFDMVKKGRGNISIGDKIKIISDNELYDEYRKKVWVITHIARSQEEHQGYDKAVGGNLVSAEGLPFSLYDWEFEKTNKKTDMVSMDMRIKGWKKGELDSWYKSDGTVGAYYGYNKSIYPYIQLSGSKMYGYDADIINVGVGNDLSIARKVKTKELARKKAIEYMKKIKN